MHSKKIGSDSIYSNADYILTISNGFNSKLPIDASTDFVKIVASLEKIFDSMFQSFPNSRKREMRLNTGGTLPEKHLLNFL